MTPLLCGDHMFQAVLHEVNCFFVEVYKSFRNKKKQARTNSPLFYADASKTDEDYFQKNPLFRAAVFTIVKQRNKKDFAAIRKAFTSKIKSLEQQLKLL